MAAKKDHIKDHIIEAAAGWLPLFVSYLNEF